MSLAFDSMQEKMKIPIPEPRLPQPLHGGLVTLLLELPAQQRSRLRVTGQREHALPLRDRFGGPPLHRVALRQSLMGPHIVRVHL